MPDDTPSIPEGRDALQQLKDSLSQQFGQTPPGPVSDMIDARLSQIDDALTALNQAGVASGTGAINLAAAAMANPLKDLNALKNQLQEIGNDAAKAAQILGGVDQFISKVTSFFGVK